MMADQLAELAGKKVATLSERAEALKPVFKQTLWSPEANGDLVINPRPPKFSPSISLKGVRIRGMSFDVSAGGSHYEVKAGQKVMTSKIGVPILLKAKLG